MKTRIEFVIMFFLLCLTTGCADKKNQNTEAVTQEITTDREAEVVPELSQIKNICELATLRCEYHNVAQSTKESGTGIAHFGEKERDFWIEYVGQVEISYDADYIKMEQNGTRITITLPAPKVTCTVQPDSWDENSYVIESDQWIQKNPITADDQTKAIREANEQMEQDVRNNSSLLNTANLQAQELIRNYINQIGNATGVTYQIDFQSEEVKTTETSME